jgi:TonB family protein
VDTGLRLRRIEDELGLAIFLRHGVVAGDRKLSEGLAVRRHTVAEHDVVHGVGKRRHAQRGGEPDNDQSLEEMFNSGSKGGTHGVNYTCGARTLIRFAIMWRTILALLTECRMSSRCTLLLALTPVLLLSTALANKNKKDTEAMALIEHAKQLSDIRSEGAPAFKLRISFKIVKKDGSATEGEYAEVWVSKGQWQRNTVVGTFRRVEVGMGRKRWLLDSTTAVPGYLDDIVGLSGIDSLQPEAWKPQKIADRVRNGLRVRCIETAQPALCFDEASGTLAYKTSDQFQEKTCSYSNYQKFGDRQVAMSYLCNEDKQTRIEARVVELAPDPTPAPALFMRPEGAKESVNCLGAVQRPTVVSSVDPTFPSTSDREGTVGLSIVVGTDGKPKDLKLLFSTGLAFNQKAVAAVRQWRFKPAMCDGEPMEYTISVEVDFHRF